MAGMTLSLGLTLGSGGGASGATPVMGFVHSRHKYGNTVSTVNKQIMGRMAQVAAAPLVGAIFGWAGYRISSGLEIGLTASTDTQTIEASVEIAGVCYPLTFNGGASTGTLTYPTTSGAVTPGANILWSDPLSVTIPAGQYHVRTFGSSTAGILYSSIGRDAPNGDLFTIGVTTPNLVAGGVIAQVGGATSFYGPQFVRALTLQGSVAACGDSIVNGVGQSTHASNCFAGIVSTGLPANTPYVNLGLPNSTSANWATRLVNGSTLFQYCSGMFCNLGVNDGLTPATTVANLQTIAALFPATAKKYNAIVTPRTTSTDAWVTTTNQTLHANSAQYNSLNALLRAGVAGFDGYIETRRGVLEASPNDSGLWQADSGIAKTDDGLHPNDAGYAVVAGAGVIPAALYTR